MLTYLLGDVLRIFAGDFRPGEIGGVQMNQAAYFGIMEKYMKERKAEEQPPFWGIRY